MTALRKTQQAAERVRYRYLLTNNGQKLLSPVVELGQSWKKLRRRETL
jgi:DNA-binding HxlR family transcriptional regulator